jgi:predicted dehydrogenase
VDIPDSLGVLARMSGGARAIYRLSTVSGAAPERANGISIYGSAGTLHWTMEDQMSFAPAGGDPQPLAPDPGAAHGWRVEQEFIDSIREGAPVTLTSFEDGVLYMRFADAVWRSWSEGRTVALASL